MSGVKVKQQRTPRPLFFIRLGFERSIQDGFFLCPHPVGTLDAYKCCGSSPDALAVSRPLTQCRIHPIWFSDHSAPA
eukprot:1177702-Prorocentrum_minimum.AAC.2